MKIGKDEIQKIALSVLLLAGFLYCYFAFLLGPLSRSHADAEKSIATLEPQIAAAKAQVKRTAQVRNSAPPAHELLDKIKSSIPAGAPVAWFPPRMADFFKRQGIDKVATHLTSETSEKDLTGFRRLIWAIDLPKVEFVPLGTALAGLENEEPLLEITSVDVEANRDDPQFQHATLTVATLVKQ